jgi:thiol:disulfide interchange protein/DsbC/DsbD-like thiol-disulfide interchange protein
MRFVLALLALVSWSFAAEAREQRIALSIVASTAAPKPGSTITLGLRFKPQPGWHGYWTNPGDSGLPPQVEWTGPAGLTFGSLRHPAPTILRVAGITSNVHAGEHMLLASVRVPSSIAAGTKLPVKANVSWLACSDTLCVPERATVEIDLTAGVGTATGNAAAIRKAQAALPQSIAAPGGYTLDGNKLHFTLPDGARFGTGNVRFFPDDNGYLDSSTTGLLAGKLTGTVTGKPPAIISGVVWDGTKALRVRFVKTAATNANAGSEPSSEPVIPAELNAANPAAPKATTSQLSRAQKSPAIVSSEAGSFAGPEQSTGSSPSLSLFVAVGGAVLGGLLLNLMPCVFPILSLKALSLARFGGSEADSRREALGYTAGALIGTGTLGGIIVLLRQVGMDVGWSFQLQDPAIILALLLLSFAIALNFAGLFELPSLSIGKAGGHSVAGSVGTGAMAAFIATPCSGPFMATALGAAMLLSAPAAMLVFLGLGLGLALPFLILAFVPASRRLLPKPGAWMATFRRILALPMLLTTVGLLWLLGRQGGAPAMTAGAFAALLIATGLWWVGLRQQGGQARSWFPLAPTAVALGFLIAIAPPRSTAAAPQTTSASVEAFSEERLAELRKAGTPVFVDFTADWCLTCKVNEKMAIHRASTQEAFAQAGVVTLQGDWTTGDPAITRFLAQHGRNSIPFYLFYSPRNEPQVLPQILTVGMLREIARSTEQQ